MKLSPNHFLGPNFAIATFHGTVAAAPLLLWPSAWLEPWERGFEAKGHRLTFGWLRWRGGFQWGHRGARVTEGYNEEKAVEQFVQWANTTLHKTWSIGRVSRWIATQPHLKDLLALSDGRSHYVRLLLAREFELGEQEASSTRQSWPSEGSGDGLLDRLDRLGETLGTQSE